MTRWPAQFRPVAVADLEHAIEHYSHNAGLAVADRFIAAVEAANAAMTTQPRRGSTSTGALLGMADVRSWRVKSFPYRLFYVFDGQMIDIWRVLHDRQVTQSAFFDND
jgi:toxin ParE1/3/4